MYIHEYQAKMILRKYNAPIAKGIVIFSIDEAKFALESLPGPIWVVKSQIHAGGRGKGKFKELSALAKGGVRLAYSKNEVILHIQEMLGNTLITNQTGKEGKKVNSIYIEDGANILNELYLSILIDRTLACPVFIISKQGGMDIELIAKNHPSQVIKVPININIGVNNNISEHLCSLLDLKDSAFEDGKKLFPNLYKIFIENDMELLEINPLIIMENNHLRILDTKISFDKNALFRHQDLLLLRDESEENTQENEASKHQISYISLKGNIGCMVNGAGLAMATMDIIKLHGAEPANFLDVGGGASKEKVSTAFKLITSDKNVKGILVNIFGGIMQCDVIAEGIVDAIKEVGLKVPLVVRLEGTNVKLGNEIIINSKLNVITANDLDDAALKIIKAIQE